MKQIPLSKGYVALVDDRDYAELSQYSWTALEQPNTVYAFRTVSVGTKRKALYMHRSIMNDPPGLDIDHINGDGLNNTRANLRVATRHQNQGNRRTQEGTSRFKGVRLHRCGKWEARIRNHGKQHYLGLFDSEKDAARAYDAAALEQWGDFALLNFPEPQVLEQAA